MHGAVHPEVRSRAIARKKTAKRPAKKRPAPRHPVRLQPESLRLRSLAVSLTVNDLAKSIAWYRDVLRFTVGERWEDSGQLLGVQLKAGSCDLMLNQRSEERRVGKECRSRWSP